MKTILKFSALFLSIMLYAQEKTYTQKMDSLMMYVDKSQMTTPILYDRVFSFSNLNASVPSSISYDYFLQSWSDMYRASYQPNFISPEHLQEYARRSLQDNQVQIGVINLKYNYIDFGTDEDPNLVFEDGYFRNVPGKNPFKEAQISLVSPLVSEITSTRVNYVFTSSTIAQDPTLSPIESIELNLGDGVIRNLNLNSQLTVAQPQNFIVNYTSGGNKNISFKLKFADGTSKTFRKSIEVKLGDKLITTNTNNGLYSDKEDFTGSRGITQTTPFRGYNESVAKSGALEYRTYYNRISNPGFNGEKFSVKPKLRKPIIILDGYDPGDGRKLDALYKQMNYYINDIKNKSSERNLINELQNKGFDVTLVNFPNGADFIERNAMAVVELLKRENDKLKQNGSSEKIILIGPSMGGLISRYALAYMEKNNIPHNTRLWVSFDSPHHGANIPLSAQANLLFFGAIGGSEQAANKFKENFFSPAARQMLIEQLDGYPNPTYLSSSSGRNNNHPFRKQFLQNLTNNGVSGSNGFPIQTRNIAIANGATTGQKTNLEGQTLLEMAGFGPLRLKAVVLVDNALPAPNNTALNFEGRFTKTVKCRIPLIRKTFTCGINIIDKKVYTNNPNPRGSMDVVQGGTFGTFDIFQQEFEHPLREKGIKDVQWRQNRHNHAFIPTVSSLAFKNPNFDWNADINRNLLCNREIPFDAYFVAKTNEEHVFVSNELVDWLMKEIEGNYQAPNLDLSNITLSTTQKILCLDETAQISINTTDPCRLPSRFTWSTSPNLQIVGNNTDNAVQVKGVQNGLGYVYVNFASGQKISQKIWVGKPQLRIKPEEGSTNYVVQSIESLDTGATLEDQGLTPADVTWRRKDTGAIRTGYTYFANGRGYNWHLDLEVNAKNKCGSTTYATTITPPPPGMCEYTYTVSKVQNDDYTIARIMEPVCPKQSPEDNNLIQSQSTSSETYHITVVNSLGNTVIQKTGKDFSLSNLPTGSYFVKIIKDGQMLVGQTLIKK